MLEFPPPGGGQQQSPLPGISGSALSARAAAAHDVRLQLQLRNLINGILADPDLDPDIYISVIQHLAENPGHPEEALLAHLGDVQEASELPPIKIHRQRCAQTPVP